MITVHQLAPVALFALVGLIIWSIKTMSAATDRLTASVHAATASVDALIARIPAPAPPVDETPVLAAADALDALKAKVDAVDPSLPPTPGLPPLTTPAA